MMSDEKILQGKTVVLGVCGSVAAFKAVELAGLLVKSGASVPVIMTAAAQEFIRPLSFEALTHETVFTGMFNDHTVEPRHISLAERADMLLIAPASANGIAKWALGMADDLLSCTAMATRAPIVIAPAMNDGMYSHPATIHNIETLKSRGVRFIGPEEGRLASGKTGLGRLTPPQIIFEQIAHVLTEGGHNVC